MICGVVFWPIRTGIFILFIGENTERLVRPKKFHSTGPLEAQFILPERLAASQMTGQRKEHYLHPFLSNCDTFYGRDGGRDGHPDEA